MAAVPHKRLIYLLLIGFWVVHMAFQDLDYLISHERFILEMTMSRSPDAGAITTSTSSSACIISRAMAQHEATLHSYPPLSSLHVSSQPDKPQSVPHLSHRLCQESSHTTMRNLMPQSSHIPATKDDPLQNIIAFKAARTGSTFFTTVITDTVEYSGQPQSTILGTL